MHSRWLLERVGIDAAAIASHWSTALSLYGISAGAAAAVLGVLSWIVVRGARAERVLARRLGAALHELAVQSAQREAAEQRVRDAQKMEAVGQLTGGIAHDFNNLLMAVLGSLELLGRRLGPEQEAASRLLDQAVQAAQRGAALTQRLLAFGRRQTLTPRPVDLAVLVGDMAASLAVAVGKGVCVETRFASGLATVMVDATQLELALINLATNARDAMGGQGRLSIRARPAPERCGDFVILSVRDTGPGMDAATLERATEPFFTTKPAGAGAGLGLSMVHGLAAQSGGRLVLASPPGEGVTAALWLPRAPIQPNPTEDNAASGNGQ